MSERAAKALLALLEEERAIILAGEYARLQDLGQTKQRLFLSLQPEATPGRLLRRLGGGTRRNQALLMAALSGLRAAGQRLLARGAATFQAYDSGGRRENVAPPTPDFARKA